MPLPLQRLSRYCLVLGRVSKNVAVALDSKIISLLVRQTTHKFSVFGWAAPFLCVYIM